MGSASSTGTLGKLGEIKKEGRIIKNCILVNLKDIDKRF
jgi:hypothetical protein